MIHSIADLLKEFVSAELDFLIDYEIPNHPTTIGTVYEGLTESILNKSIFEGLNLRIVKNSFIVGSSKEFDIMLVEGDGELIPYTDRYKYFPEKVIAIIQVKKNLYGKDIAESHDNLKILIDYFEGRKAEPFVNELFRDSYRTICRKELPKNIEELTFEEEYIYETLKIEAKLPVRVVWGYNGFKSEYNFRESFYDYLSENITTDYENKIGYFGAHNFANLIICDKFSMIKQNGMPFISPLKKDYWWSFLITSSFNPTYFFLELIWTRLCYKFKLSSDIFGEDLTMEPGNKFLDCKITKIENHHGWEYKYTTISNENLKSNTETIEWQPTELDAIQNVIINELCEKGEINLKAGKELEEYVKTGNYKNLDEFTEKLLDTGLVTINNGKLVLLTDKCQCAIMPDGKFVAGENKSGRFTNWILKEIEKNKDKQ